MFAISELARALVRLERANAEESLAIDNVAFRAAEFWYADRTFEAVELAEKLKKRPEVISKKLERSFEGTRWKMSSWYNLLRCIENDQPWTDAEESWACDLMGFSHENLTSTDFVPLKPNASPEDMKQQRHGAIRMEIARLEEWFTVPPPNKTAATATVCLTGIRWVKIAL